MHYSPREYPVFDTNTTVTITKEEQDEVLKKGGFLVEGRYVYINNNTFFKVFPTEAASTTALDFSPIIRDVSTFPNIFPQEYSTHSSAHVRISTLSLQTTMQEGGILRDCIQMMNREVVQSLQKEELCTIVLALVGSREIQKKAELTYTYGLSEEIVSFLGDQFVVTSNQAVLGKKNPYCQFATSRPDTLFHHRTKYVSRDTVLGLSVDEQETPMSPAGSEDTLDALECPQSSSMIAGFGTEDKVKGPSGEPQVIAAMILKAAYLGKEAISEAKFFQKAIVFGYLRSLEDHGQVVPYRMLMDFEQRTCIVYKGQLMNIGDLLGIVKNVLENPEKIR